MQGRAFTTRVALGLTRWARRLHARCVRLVPLRQLGRRHAHLAAQVLSPLWQGRLRVRLVRPCRVSRGTGRAAMRRDR